MDNWFTIQDIEEFTDKTRTIVYANFGSWDEKTDTIKDEISNKEKDELDTVLSHNEAKSIILCLVKKQKNKITKEIRYVVDDDIFANILHDLNARMISNILNGLVRKGLIESSYDSETNDFVFWVKE